MKPLSTPVTTLPHFMPNQVLTETQLNGVVDYLEQQERFTRERLIGIGIVCGLQASLVTNAEIQNVTISRGVGISSAGYLFNLPDDLPLDKQRVFNPKNYKPFANLNDPCYELLLDDTAAANTTAISLDPSNSVFVLFLDIQDTPNGKCLGQDCDEKGNSYVFTLRVLVISKNDAEEVIRNSYPINEGSTLYDYFNPAYSLPTVFIERFGYLSNNNNAGYFDLPNIQDFDTFENDYLLAIKNGAQRLDAAISKAFDTINMSFMFKDIFDKQLDPDNLFSGYSPTTLFAKCTQLLDHSQSYYKKGNCQYIYDFLRDLIDTYHELRDELFAYYAACCPKYGLFPRHLFLGLGDVVQFGQLLPESITPSYHYRDKFIPSHAQTIEVQYLKRIKQLIQRLQLQITELDLSTILSNGFGQEQEVISIIPDKTNAAPLGDRSIPFYYNDNQAQLLYKYWNYDKLVQNRPFENRSYFAAGFQYPPGLDSSYMKSPVLFDIAKYPKFTIQGHVGVPLSQAVNDLQDQKLQYNLSFDILLLKLGSLNTGVILADDSLIADLQAQYMAYRNELVCCVEDLISYIDKNGGTITKYFLFMLEIILTKNKGASTNTNSIQTIAAIIEKVLHTFNLSLALMVKSLPTDIKLFRFQKLYEIYPAVSSFASLFKLIITSWGDLEGFFVNANTPAEITAAEVITIMLNIWELYLDTIADDCVLANFLTIHQLYQERVNTFSYFSEFNAQVHGMEHISGTTNGGTFIMVYDNAKRRKRVFTGKVVSENGHALAGAAIMDARDHGVLLTKTAADGTFRVDLPDDVESVAVQHKDFSLQEIPLVDKNIGTTKLYSHDSYVKGTNINLPPVASETDKVYINLMSAASQFKEMAATTTSVTTETKKTTLSNADRKIQAGMLAEVLNIRKPSSTFNSVVVNSNTEFVVVADFSLPHLIHNYKTRVAPFDACRMLKDVKLIDFTALSSLLSKNVTTSGSTGVWNTEKL